MKFLRLLGNKLRTEMAKTIERRILKRQNSVSVDKKSYTKGPSRQISKEFRLNYSKRVMSINENLCISPLKYSDRSLEGFKDADSLPSNTGTAGGSIYT